MDKKNVDKNNNTFGVASFIIALIPILYLPFTILLSQVGYDLGMLSNTHNVGNYELYFGMITVYQVILFLIVIILSFVFSYKQEKIGANGYSLASFIIGIIYVILLVYGIIHLLIL